ncbi:MAG: DHH family phosphoesterase, partial [Candidatus Omnitrophica bacterium]|nr:DHH family phosphoesterase [Candidatus Omnitrophota bacterium]
MKIKTQIKKTIQSLSSFLITTHINPEGDAIGSQLFLYRMIKKMGKKCTMLNCDPVPSNLNFLPGVDKVGLYRGGEVDIDKFDAFIILDCANPERMGALSEFVSSASKTINIDHH